MRFNRTLGLSLSALLLVSLAMVVSSTPWDGVPDDPTPAQAIWVDPQNTTCFVGDTFVVDVLINITDPDGAGPATGFYGFDYKLLWNSTLLMPTDITFHNPWSAAYSLLVKNETGVWPDGRSYHWLCIAAIVPATPFTGVTSLCTYNFSSMTEGSSVLDIQEDEMVDDLATLIAHTTLDGYVVIRSLPTIPWFPVTWKWLNSTEDPVWLTANVTVSSSYPIENFNFNRSLGQMNFNITSTIAGSCNVTVPKLLMDGAFKVFINDMQVPCVLTWNQSQTFICFTYSQGAHNIKIIGEIVARVRGPDLLALSDVNGDGIVDVVDLVIVALRFGWEEDG